MLSLLYNKSIMTERPKKEKLKEKKRKEFTRLNLSY